MTADSSTWEGLKQRFHIALLSRYRTTIGAWRELDPQRKGRIAFFDFCRVCRAMGYERETKHLWEALDENRDGFVTLNELDPEVAAVLQAFSSYLTDALGSAEDAWQQHFSNAGSPSATRGVFQQHGQHFGRVPQAAFQKACREAGFEGDADAVYDALNVDRTGLGVSYKEFILLDGWFKTAPLSSSFGKQRTWDFNTLRGRTRSVSASRVLE